MAETFIQVNSGSGPKAHGWDRTIGANTVIDGFFLPGEYPVASYFVNPAAAISGATVNDHILEIMAGSSLNVRIRRITVEQSANATTGQVQLYGLYRLTSAGTGGTAVTPAKAVGSDSAAGATAMTLPTVKGSESTEWKRTVHIMRQTVATAGTQPDDTFEWTPMPNHEGFFIPAGTANGFALKVLVGVATATLVVNVEIVETSFT